MTDRYTDAAHRVQTAISVLMNRDPDYSAVQPKHMRVGIDMSKSDMCGLARLLIAKGVFTEPGYLDAITEAAENEALAYEKLVQATLSNRNIRTV